MSMKILHFKLCGSARLGCRECLRKLFDTPGDGAYIAAPQHGPGDMNPGSRTCPPPLDASKRTELFATEAKVGHRYFDK
jgi:hypothetical protein